MFGFKKKTDKVNIELIPSNVVYKCRYCGKIFYREYSDRDYAPRIIFHECGGGHNNYTGIADVIAFKDSEGIL